MKVEIRNANDLTIEEVIRMYEAGEAEFICVAGTCVEVRKYEA